MKLILTIIDGLGDRPCINNKTPLEAAKTPNLDDYKKKYPNSQLLCSGQAVGLPQGTMGNSEVGHLNLGAGRIVYQSEGL